MVKQLYQTDCYKEFCYYLDTIGIDKIKLGKWTKLLNKKKVNPDILIFLYFCNPINKNNRHILNKKQIDKFYTFDENKAKNIKYKINYNPQFYIKKVKRHKRKIIYDVCFIGRDKGRLQLINEIQNKLVENKLTSNISVIKNEDEFASYSKYLKMIEQSRCILDIATNNQQGLSLCVMESLFLEKS